MLGEQEEEAREPGIPIVHAIGKQVSRQAVPSSLMAGGEEGDDNPITAELAVRSQRGRKEVGARAKGREADGKKGGQGKWQSGGGFAFGEKLILLYQWGNKVVKKKTRLGKISCG